MAGAVKIEGCRACGDALSKKGRRVIFSDSFGVFDQLSEIIGYTYRYRHQITVCMPTLLYKVKQTVKTGVRVYPPGGLADTLVVPELSDKGCNGELLGYKTLVREDVLRIMVLVYDQAVYRQCHRADDDERGNLWNRRQNIPGEVDDGGSQRQRIGGFRRVYPQNTQVEHEDDDGDDNHQPMGNYPRSQHVQPNPISNVQGPFATGRGSRPSPGTLVLPVQAGDFPTQNAKTQPWVNNFSSQESNERDSDSTEYQRQGRDQGFNGLNTLLTKGYPNERNTDVGSSQSNLDSQQYNPVVTEPNGPVNTGWVVGPDNTYAAQGPVPSDTTWNVGADETYAVQGQVGPSNDNGHDSNGGRATKPRQRKQGSDSSESSEEDGRRGTVHFPLGGINVARIQPQNNYETPDRVPNYPLQNQPYPRFPYAGEESEEGEDISSEENVKSTFTRYRTFGSEESSSSSDDQGFYGGAVFYDQVGGRHNGVSDTEDSGGHSGRHAGNNRGEMDSDSSDTDSRSNINNFRNPTSRSGPFHQDSSNGASEDKDTLYDEIFSEEERSDGPRDADHSDEDYSPNHSSRSSEERHNGGEDSSDESGSESESSENGAIGYDSDYNSGGDSSSRFTCSIDDIDLCLGKLAKYNPQILSTQLYSSAEELCRDVVRMRRCFDKRIGVCSSDVLYGADVIQQSTRYICEKRQDFEEVYNCLTEASDIYSKCYISRVVTEKDSTLIQRKCRPVENFEECVSTVTSSECGDKAGATVRDYYGNSTLNPKIRVETETTCPFIEALEEPAITEETKTALAVGLTLAGCVVIGAAVITSAIIGARKRTQMQHYILDEA